MNEFSGPEDTGGQNSEDVNSVSLILITEFLHTTFYLVMIRLCMSTTLETQSKMKGFSLSVPFVKDFAHPGELKKKSSMIMGCLFNEIMRFCSKNNIGFIYG